VLCFYGDPKEWEPWRLHLEKKFDASAIDFPNKQTKIDYIYDHCKSTASQTIEPAFTTGGIPFKTSGEMLEVLHNKFRAVDAIADATLKPPFIILHSV